MPISKKTSVNAKSRYPLDLYQGMTYSQEFTWKSGGVAVPLSGKVIRLHIKGVFPTLLVLSSDESPNSLGSFVSITNESAGKFVIQLSSAQTATALTNGKYWIEYQVGDVVKPLWLPDNVIVHEI
jgi:hypothetical protein